MSEYVKHASGVADQYLTALAESQEQFLKTLTTFSSWLPKVPAAPGAGVRRGAADPEGSRGGELRVRAQAAQAAEGLRREARRRDHAPRTETRRGSRRSWGRSSGPVSSNVSDERRRWLKANARDRTHAGRALAAGPAAVAADALHLPRLDDEERRVPRAHGERDARVTPGRQTLSHRATAPPADDSRAGRARRPTRQSALRAPSAAGPDAGRADDARRDPRRPCAKRRGAGDRRPKRTRARVKKATAKTRAARRPARAHRKTGNARVARDRSRAGARARSDARALGAAAPGSIGSTRC